VYRCMLACIADEMREKVRADLDSADAIGIQIDGSSDRQQLPVKFVTAKVVINNSTKLIFLTACDPICKGAHGLLEAFEQGVENPGNVSGAVTFMDDPNADGNDENDYLVNKPVVVKADYTKTVYSKIFAVTTDGESANTGKHGGLWCLLQERLNRMLMCVWCVCHRSDLAWSDTLNRVTELRHLYGDIKDTLRYFRTSPSRTSAVKQHCSTMGISYKQFQNPPEVRFADHMLAMCASLLNNLPACRIAWKDIAENGDRQERSRAVGFIKMWCEPSRNSQLLCVIHDALQILANLHKEFQSSSLLVLEVPVVQERYVQRLRLMVDAPNPGAAEENQLRSLGQSEMLDTATTHTAANADEVLCKRRRISNLYVTTSQHSYSAIRQEIILTLANFLDERVDPAQNKLLDDFIRIFQATTPTDMINSGRNCLVLTKSKISQTIALICSFSYLNWLQHLH
jgi:hypothetical protein